MSPVSGAVCGRTVPGFGDGILFFDLLKWPPVPEQEIARRRPAEIILFSKPPMRRLASALGAKAAAGDHDDEPVVLEFPKPASNAALCDPISAARRNPAAYVAFSSRGVAGSQRGPLKIQRNILQHDATREGKNGRVIVKLINKIKLVGEVGLEPTKA